ncbi:hypothetical protein DUNSADRAFT_8063 [Dunaliella salina]|uniref:Encoded protein n=1 Tax=Dunaliella salina TaxID=3046 RepID=A0ABQ7GK62_DUNSA|nr:hypothetical protein DUNSADRAFT_8063 [Dunaliella salina]|eukprot:KAF5835006.1 hypothetical protein DUNSADRAFT_8063 [Dunaliella salina]
MNCCAHKSWHSHCAGAPASKVLGLLGSTKSIPFHPGTNAPKSLAGATLVKKIRHIMCAAEQVHEGQGELDAAGEADTWAAYHTPTGYERKAGVGGSSSRLPARKRRRRRMLRVLPSTDASALTRLLTVEIHKTEEVVVQAVGVQGSCVALCAISQARSASHTLSFDLAMKPLMLVGDPPPNVRHGPGNAGKKTSRQRAAGRLSDRFLFFLHRVPLQAGVLAAVGQQQQQQQQQQQPLVAEAGSEKHAFPLSAMLARALFSKRSQGPGRAARKGFPRDAGGWDGSGAGVVAADGNALLRALQGICLARGRVWKRGTELPRDAGLDLLVFVEAPHEPLVADDGKQKGTRHIKQAPVAMTAVNERAYEGVHFLAFLCGKWDWDVRMKGCGGLDFDLTEEGYIAPAAEDELIMPL